MSRKKTAWINKKIPSTVLSLILAAVFLAGAVMEHAESAFLIDHGVQTQAEVVEEGFGRYSDTWVSFETDDAGVVEVRLGNPSELASKGSIIVVVYDPDDPARNADARSLGSFAVVAKWWGMAAFCAILAGLIGFGVIDWERWSRRR